MKRIIQKRNRDNKKMGVKKKKGEVGQKKDR